MNGSHAHRFRDTSHPSDLPLPPNTQQWYKSNHSQSHPIPNEFISILILLFSVFIIITAYYVKYIGAYWFLQQIILLFALLPIFFPGSVLCAQQSLSLGHTFFTFTKCMVLIPQTHATNRLICSDFSLLQPRKKKHNWHQSDGPISICWLLFYLRRQFMQWHKYRETFEQITFCILFVNSLRDTSWKIWWRHAHTTLPSPPKHKMNTKNETKTIHRSKTEANKREQQQL